LATKSLYPVCFVILLAGCTPSGKDLDGEAVMIDDKTNKITNINWFQGNYEFISEEGIYREFWRKRNNTEFSGKGYFLHKGDTSYLMRMELFADYGMIKMTYEVKGQNGNKSTEFALTKQEKGLFVFENPFGGFPSVMRYKLQGDTAINIIERGFEDQKEKVKEFTLIRIKGS
jgi:hypothetical protein